MTAELDEDTRDACGVYAMTFGFAPIDEVRGDLELQKQSVTHTFYADLQAEDVSEEERWRTLYTYLRHCGMGPALNTIDRNGEMPFLDDLVLPHYALPGGGYDLVRVVKDFESQPDIQARMAYLRTEQTEKLEHRRRQKAESKRRRREAKRATAGSQS